MMIILHKHCLRSPQAFLNGIVSIHQGEQVVLEFEPKYLSKTLIAWHQKKYPWHHDDTIRSYTSESLRAHGNNGKRVDFAYMHRAAKYFGYDQLKEHRAQPNKLICLWDPSTDGDNFGEHNPCLVMVRFRQRRKALDMVAIYRKRDLLTRMIGNLMMLTQWLQHEAKQRRLLPGCITDFSMDVQYDEKQAQRYLLQVEGNT